MFSDLRFRLRALFSRRAMEQELDTELRFHLERETEKLVRRGLSRDDAERRARIAFGGVDRIKDDARDARGVALIDTLRQDLRYAWRGLRSKPGFAAAVVVTLGLGIGANAAMFGITDRLLFRAPAFLVDAGNVHRVFVNYMWRGEHRTEHGLPYRRYLEFRSQTRSFDRVAAVTNRRLAIGTGVDAREMNVATVSASLFDFFSARPVLGRFFTAAEDSTPAGATVAVLSHALWQTRFGGAPDVLGKSLNVGSQLYAIVGVAPEGFEGIGNEGPPAVFVPITTFASSRNATYYQDYNWTWLEMVVHRRPGVSVATANADLSAAYARSWDTERELIGASYPRADAARAGAEAGHLLLARGPEAGADSRVATWVMGVAFIVLLVACANVTNLLLARAVARRREVALRLALGITRRRLVQQLLTESALIAAIGGIAGLVAAQFGGRALRALFLSARTTGDAVLTDARTVGFVAVITLVVAVLTGLAPALQTLRADFAGSLKTGTREGTYRRSRLRTALLVFQGALSVVLLVGAGLFVRSLANVRAMRLGYDVEPLVYLEANPRGVQLSDAQQGALSDRLLAAATSMPGTASASIVVSVPFWSSEGRGAPIVNGRDSLQRLGRFELQAGNEAYFRTLGTRILRGRGISADDRSTSSPVLVVSDAMAKAIWPGEEAIGRQVRFEGPDQPWRTVVGVAEDIRGSRLTGDPEFWYYVPIEQYKGSFGAAPLSMMVRVEGRAEDFQEPLRKRLQQELPGDAYMTSMRLGQLLAPRQRSWDVGARMFVAFGGLALVLAAIGLYSVIAYAVAQRTHELGVRIALGASVGDVVGMIVGQGMAFAVAGIAIGSVIALWAGKWVEPLLFAQKSRDPVVFAAVAAVLLVVAIVATLRPAIRATRVDPTVALRSD